MPGDNVLGFYLIDLEQAKQAFEQGDIDVADDICKTLVTDFDCPRLIQVSAWQLRSNITKGYWLGRDFLTEALRIGEALYQDHELVRESTEHAVRASLATVYDRGAKGYRSG